MKSKSSFESYEIDLNKYVYKSRSVLSVARHTVSIFQPEIWAILKHIEAQPKYNMLINMIFSYDSILFISINRRKRYCLKIVFGL